MSAPQSNKKSKPETRQKVPRVSVVIPTYNRRLLLEKVLDSLAKVKHQPGEMEVIVVDDGSSDNTVEALSRRKDPFALRVLRHDRSQGPAAARNRGAAAAQGTILAFVDSDVVVDAQWWEKAARHFEDPNVAGVEGATVSPEATPVPTPLTHVVSNRKGGNYITCNMFYRRELFLQVGGFDERFLRANREDSDLAFSILETGHRIVFEPASRVEHPVFPAPWDVFLRETRYGLHEPLLRRKHPVLYKRCLKWIDGRAFPIFYWGMFLGGPFLLAGTVHRIWLLALAGAGAFGLGWAGAVYAVCRKRRVRVQDVMILAPQYLIIPWVRLYWVLRGEWKYRMIKPGSVSGVKQIK